MDFWGIFFMRDHGTSRCRALILSENFDKHLVALRVVDGGLNPSLILKIILMQHKEVHRNMAQTKGVELGSLSLSVGVGGFFLNGNGV